MLCGGSPRCLTNLVRHCVYKIQWLVLSSSVPFHFKLFSGGRLKSKLVQVPSYHRSPLTARQKRFRNDFHQIEGHDKNVQDVPIHLLQKNRVEEINWHDDWTMPRWEKYSKRVIKKSGWWLNQPFFMLINSRQWGWSQTIFKPLWFILPESEQCKLYPTWLHQSGSLSKLFLV